jgi:adenylate cyclase
MGKDLQTTSSRLWSLIEERTHAGADTQTIDRRIWDLFGEEWAIMFTDLSGFSRQVAQFGIIHFLQIIFEKKRLLFPVIEKHDGVLVKVEADSFLLLFRNPAAAIACALEMQRVCKSYSARRPPEEQVILCVGVGFGKLLRVGNEDVFGHEVNLASKLGEDTAKGHEILVTRAAQKAAGDMPGVQLETYDVEFAGETSCYRVKY